MLPTLKYNKEKLYKAAGEGYTAATDCADYLVKKGLPFREAHHVVGSLVKAAQAKGVQLDKLSIKEFKAASKLFDADIVEVLKIENIVAARNITGGPAAEVVKKRIKDINEELGVRS